MKENFENNFVDFLNKKKKERKKTYLHGEFDLNLLDYDAYLKLKSYCNTVIISY